MSAAMPRDGDSAEARLVNSGAMQKLELALGTTTHRFAVDQAETLRALDAEIARAEEAYRLMTRADELMKFGADDQLELLGFTAQHVAELRRRAGPGGGYPPYSLANIQETLRTLRDARRHCTSEDFQEREKRS